MKWLYLFLMLMMGTNLLAQAEVVVISSKGKVWYQTSDQSAKKSLYPGQKIKALGTVQLENNSQLTLLSSGNTYRLNEAGKHTLSTVIPAENTQKMGFASRFWSFLTDGLINSDNQKSLDKYHKQHMSVAGGVRGFAGPDVALSTVLPTYGKLTPGIIEFQWNPVDAEKVIYQLDITDARTNTLVYRALYKSPLVQIDLRPLALEDLGQYRWQLRALDKDSKKILEEIPPSPAYDFQFVLDPDPMMTEALDNVEGYQEADVQDQAWMEAVVMEQEGFPYMAYRRYLKLRLIHPKDLLLKKLFAAFLVRQDQLSAARELITP